jgi:hypothetical protein
MRRLARSTARQSQTFRRRWPTDVHILSSSSAFHSFFCSVRGRKRRSRLRFFCPAGNHDLRHARHAGNAALRIAFAQQLVHLRILDRFGHGDRGKAGLVIAAFALIFGMAPSSTIEANIFTAASGAEMLCKNYPQN